MKITVTVEMDEWGTPHIIPYIIPVIIPNIDPIDPYTTPYVEPYTDGIVHWPPDTVVYS